LGLKLENVKAAFGRGEELIINNSDLRLQLIKNPASFTQSLKLLGKTSYDTIAIVINDDHADSRDVSWLWDVEFDILKPHEGEVITGGTRAADMALRLKYDEVKTSRIMSKNKELIEHLISTEGKKVLLYCTYTAMWQLRKELVKQGHVSFVR
jgi:lipid II isoglutaminyl synthase (glutamine-hydrolysing)